VSIDPALRAIMTKINKKNPGTVFLGSDIVPPKRPTITSGSLNLDAALGGGWATGHWNEIIGHESVGKTYIVLKMIEANQKLDPNFTVVWFATEDFNEDYAKLLGVNIDQIIIENENLMERVYQHAKDFLDTKKVDCIVIDSLPFLVPEREDENTMEDFQPGLAAFLTGKFFRKSMHSIKRSMIASDERPCTGFIINGWREKFTTRGDPRISPGGKGKNFVFFQRVDLSRVEWITNTKEQPVGQVMRIKNLKNKYARPGLIGQVDAYVVDYQGHAAGQFDLVKDAISAGIAYEVINHPDNLHYTFNGQTFNGRPKLEAAIQEDPVLATLLRRAVLAAALDPIDINDGDEVEEPAPKPRKQTVKKRAVSAKG
jgi:recombination protein RecA